MHVFCSTVDPSAKGGPNPRAANQLWIASSPLSSQTRPRLRGHPEECDTSCCATTLCCPGLPTPKMGNARASRIAPSSRELDHAHAVCVIYAGIAGQKLVSHRQTLEHRIVDGEPCAEVHAEEQQADPHRAAPHRASGSAEAASKRPTSRPDLTGSTRSTALAALAREPCTCARGSIACVDACSLRACECRPLRCRRGRKMRGCATVERCIHNDCASILSSAR